MIFSSTDWRSAAEDTLKHAARALGCEWMPRECVRSIPVPIGKPRVLGSTSIDPDAVMRLGDAVLAMGRAGLTELQCDLVWCRAFDLSWKEIEARHPNVPRRTLEWNHAEALAGIARGLRLNEK